METIKQEILSLRSQLAAVQAESPINENKANAITNRISELEYELAQSAAEQAAVQQEREQKVQEVNESNSEIVVQIFDALVPDPKTFESLMGLTEFSEWRTGFYQLFDGALAERTKLMDDKHAYELAQKDEKIRLLSKQGVETQQQLDELNKQLIGERENYEGYKADHENFVDDLKGQLAKAERDLNEAKEEVGKGNAAISENCDLRRQILELEDKLAVAQQPKTESKPSQSFTDRMNEIKSKNEARIKSAAELAAENALGFRGKVEIPSIETQGSPFRDETNPALLISNQFPSTETVENVGASFPQVQSPALPTVEVRGSQGHGSSSEVAEEERITRAEVEAIVEAKFAEYGLVKGQVA